MRTLDPLTDQLGSPIEDRGALVLGKIGRLEGLAGGPHGAVDQGRVAKRHPADRAAVVGALDLAPLAGLAPLASGEELVVDCLDRLHRHLETG